MKVTNWDKWQSFRKDRGTPPWIKLHRNLFSNPEWVSLSDAERGQLVVIWLLSAEKNGQVPDDPQLVAKMGMMSDAPDLTKFAELGFLTTTCQPLDVKVTHQSRVEKSRVEKSREEKHSVIASPPVKPKAYPKEFESFWLAYPANRRGNKKRAVDQWDKVPPDQQVLLEDIVSQRKLNDLDWRKDNFSFVPHVERYLSGERWLDEWRVEQKQYSDVTAKNIQTLSNWKPKGWQA